MRFTVDPWDPSYGASVQTELGEAMSPATTDIERADHQWARADLAQRLSQKYKKSELGL